MQNNTITFRTNGSSTIDINHIMKDFLAKQYRENYIYEHGDTLEDWKRVEIMYEIIKRES